ncbi:ferredoxin-fold anticodon-binding domain-containing protein 1 [Spinachia spinachia]
MSPSGSTLLVGEGNLSFSASLSSETETRITATCPQRREDALRHDGAAENMKTIRDSGGLVLFEVDCTRLGQCASLRGCFFDRVVFNFPHCGRKSGVKKNRELLKNFFLSCVQLLSEDGEVHVSLCNGQGGTPADQPKREWHNSWQVAAMAAEAHLILKDVLPFEKEKYQRYKCTGYRSQDKGFHVENGLLHVFTRSLPYSQAEILKVEEAVDGDQVLYNIPAELSDFVFRGFLSSGSVHPVRLVQDFLLKGLAEKWSVSMTTQTVPFLLKAKRLQASGCDVDAADCYWIHLLRKDVISENDTSTDKERDTQETLARLSLDKVDRVSTKGAESLRSACLINMDPEGESGLYMLRPSMLPQMEELLTRKEAFANNAARHGAEERNKESVEVEGHKKGPLGGCNGVPSLFGLSGLVFKNVPVNLWDLPAFHELLLRGVFPSACEPIRLIGQRLETLLAPFGVSLVTEPGGLRMTALQKGLVGKVFANNPSDDVGRVSVTMSLNLDLLSALLFSLPDWRLLWCHDPRFLQQFELRTSPGKPFQPFSLFPEHFSFDISFWTGPTWAERKFHAAIREASHGTVEQVKLMDTFAHPDLSQTSYCYRLIYHSNTHALSHTQALQFHKDLETFLTSRLQATIR